MQSLITASQRRTIYFKTYLYVEDLGPNAVNEIRTHNLLIDNLCLITRTPSHRENLKALNFWQWNQSRFSNPLKAISSYQHFQILHV